MKMPEKIYLIDYNDAMVTPLEGDTIYVREDAFIEKAAEWLDKTLRNTDFYEDEIELMVKEFKKAMKL
jgi:aminoglycoside/choline kinase family phosphotransferase